MLTIAFTGQKKLAEIKLFIMTNDNSGFNHDDIEVKDLKTGYKKSSGRSRNIKFIITKDGEDTGKDFVADMPDSNQMVFPFGAFLLIENRNGRGRCAATVAASHTARRR